MRDRLTQRGLHVTGSRLPLVSVIIPAFNSGAWLAQAIESVLAQTYPNVEVVVVNDGSIDQITDRTARAYLPHITYIERENGGVAAARNSGIAASNGELIALLDQDDLWLPHKLQTQVSILRACPHLGLVHSSFDTINSHGHRTGTIRLSQREYRPLPSLLLHVPIASCTTLFPRHLLDEVGTLDPALAGSDDWDLWLRMAAQGYSFYCIGEPLAYYREHSGNTSRNIDLMVQASIATLDKFYTQANLPTSVADARTQAYFNKHAWATSLYYGAGRTDSAQDHLRIAARYYPRGLATGRFLQSLIYARWSHPVEVDARSAIRFVYQTLSAEKLPSSVRRNLRSHSELLLALHTVGKARMVGKAAYLLLGNPHLLTDRELWAAGRKRLLRIALKLRSMIPGQREIA